MRKIIALVFIAIAFTNAVKAQYVDIPDDYFRNYLQSRYPTCFNTVGQMDTACAGTINEYSLDFSNTPVRNLDGLQYFKRLKSMYFIYNAVLETIPKFPDSLTSISCFGSILNSLPTLPPGLTQLDCSQNNIASLPALPANLTNLNCGRNEITNLPALPGTLEYLNCEVNRLTSLPALPAGLRTLNFSSNTISSLPVIPGGLTTLSCRGNLLRSLPNFPNSLYSIDCSYNPLYNLPGFPPSTREINCAGDSLSTLPALPNFLNYLECSNNQLTSLPTLPDHDMIIISCAGNKLTSLPKLPVVRELNCSNNLLTSLPEIPGVWRLTMTNNNILCLPKILPLNNDGATVYIDSTIKCNPNHDWRISLNINLPHCYPSNNINHCEAFPVIGGTVFYDANNNGIRDANEFFKRNARLNLSNGNYTFSNAKGQYEISTDSIGSFSLGLVTPIYFNAAPLTTNFTFTTNDTFASRSFALQPTATIAALDIQITPLNWAARPGFSFPYLISYENIGTATLTPTVTFNYDDTRLTFDSVSNPGVVNNGSSLILNLGSFAYGQQGSFVGYFKVKPTAALGDTLTATAIISAGIVNASDTATAVILGSFDPNDKQATPQLSPSQVASGKYIDYTIRFQNTGTDTAFNIVISDTLNADLQAGALEMLLSSHNCKTTVKDNIVFFEFLNILLPDSNITEPMSHGFVCFRIKPQTTVAVNTTIPNKAAIYFDYNAPVITNTAGTLIKEFTVIPLKLISFSAVPQNDNTTSLYWNTANEINTRQFVIERGNDGLQFSSITSVVAKGMASNNYSINIADDNTGIIFYRLKMIDNDSRFSYSPIIKIDRRKNTTGFTVLSNPVKDLIIINTTDRSLTNTQASIINMQGAVVKTFIVKENLQSIDIKTLPPGIYFIKSISGSQKILVK